MICENCGKETDEDQEYCSHCAAYLNAPKVITLSKEDIKNSKKKSKEPDPDAKLFDIALLGQSLKKDYAKDIAIIAAILTYLSPFMGWLVKKKDGNTITASLFDISGKSAALGLGQKSFSVIAIVLIIIAFLMLLFAARDSIRPLRVLSDKVILWIIPGVIATIMYVLIAKNAFFIAAEKRNLVSYGIGKNLCILGALLYLIAVVMDKINAE